MELRDADCACTVCTEMGGWVSGGWVDGRKWVGMTGSRRRHAPCQVLWRFPVVSSCVFRCCCRRWATLKTCMPTKRVSAFPTAACAAAPAGAVPSATHCTAVRWPECILAVLRLASGTFDTQPSLRLPAQRCSATITATRSALIPASLRTQRRACGWQVNRNGEGGRG